METTHPFRFSDRGPSTLVRLVFFTSLSLLLMFVDLRYHSLESTRRALSILVSPVQRMATLPDIVWENVRERMYRQDSLVRANDLLEKQHDQDLAQLQKLSALEAENQRLRTLASLSLPPQYQAKMVEILYGERDVFKRKILVDKGANVGIEAGQVVMDAQGIVGQVTRVYPWLSEISLITDKDQAVPVLDPRSNLRTILQGTGNTSTLSIRYLANNADIKPNDILVTSGLDGVYPAGIPVARVTKIEIDPSSPFARITCVPIAGVDRGRHLLVLSTLPKLPDIPVEVVPEKPGKTNKSKRKKP